jgi:transcriptional regulator with XRE-family HTH domain
MKDQPKPKPTDPASDLDLDLNQDLDQDLDQDLEADLDLDTETEPCDNNLFELRNSIGMTRSELAGRLGCSPIQLDRFERCHDPIPLPMALALPGILDTEPGRIFPEAARAFEALRQERTKVQDGRIHLPRELIEAFREQGIEAENALHTLTIRLTGSSKWLAFRIHRREAERLRNALHGPLELSGPSCFLRFDSFTESIAVHPSRLEVCHFLFDPMGLLPALAPKAPAGDPEEGPEPDPETGENSSLVRVYLKGEPEPLTFGLDPGEDAEVSFPDLGQLAALLEQLESGPEAGDRVSFIDVDGEEVFIRAEGLAMIRIPHHLMFNLEDEPDSSWN